MVTRYPASIDNSSTLPTVIDNVTGVHAVTVNILRDTAIAIEAQLGVKPAGLFSTVRARLDAMEALIQSAVIGEITFSGDLSGTVTHQTVIGLQTNPIQSGVLGSTQDGYVLTWNNGAFQWQAKPTANAFVGSGDLFGTATSQTVIGWENKLLDAATMGSPTDGYVPVWVAGSNRWKALSPESVIGELILAGDVTGAANSNKVVALQHHAVASQTLGASQDGYVLSWDNGDGYWKGIPNAISSGSVTPGTAGQVFITNSTPVSAWTSLIKLELVHGRFTAGGSGSDFKAVIGPYVGGETLDAALYFLPGATAPTSTNYTVASDQVSTYYNVPSGGLHSFYRAGAALIATIEGVHGRGTFGGSGSDFKAVIGPLPGAETTFASLHFLAGATTAAGNNYNLASNATDLYLGASGVINFAIPGVGIVGNIEMTHGKGTFGGGGSDFKAVLGPVVGAETSTSALWLLSNGTSPSITNMAMYSDGASTVINAQSGTGVIYLGYASSLNSTINHLGVWNFAASQSPTLSQSAPGATSAGTDMTLAPQSGGATSGQPGALVVNLAAPNGGSSENWLKIERGGTLLWQLGPYTAFPTTFAAIYPGGVTPSAANYIFAATVAGDNISFNSSALIGMNIANASKVVIDPTNWTFTGLANVLFDPSINLPNITHSQSTTGSGQKLTIRAQDGYTTHPANGGNLFLSSGAKNSSGTDGYVAFLTGGNMGARISSTSALTGSGDGYVKVDNTGLLSFISTIGTGGITSGTAGQIFVTNASPASVWTSLISYETTHGRFSAGTGSDFIAGIGPLVSLETSAAALYLVPNATAFTANNFALYGDGTSLVHNTRGAGGAHYFYAANATEMAHLSTTLLAMTTTPLIQWGALVANPTISQVAPAATTAGTTFTIAPQAGGATSGVPGSLVVNIAAPNGGSADNFFKVQRGGTTHWQIGPLTSVPTTFGAFYPGGVTPSGTNYAFYVADDGSNMGFNSSSVIGMNIGGANQLSLATGNLYWAAGIALPAYGQAGLGSDVAPTNLIFRAQAPFASAATNLLPGRTVIDIPSSVGAGNLLGGVDITYGGNRVVTAGTYGGTSGGSYGYAALWFGSSTPGAGNYSFLGDAGGNSTYLNASSNLYFAFGGGVSGGHWRATDLTLGSTAGSGPISFGFGTPAAPTMIFGFGGTGAVTAQIYTLAPSNDVAPANLYLGAQGPFASATVNRHPGQLTAQVPTPLGANDFYGGLLVQAASGPTPLVRVGHYGGPDVTYAAIYFMDAGTPNSVNFGFLGNQTFTYLNTVNNGVLRLSMGAQPIIDITGGSNTAANTNITGSIQNTTRSSLTNFTIDTTTTDRIIRVTATQTVTLPTPTVGRMLEIWLDGYSGVDVTLTLARHASEKINGLAASFIVTASADPTGGTGQTIKLCVRSIDGTNWLVAS